MERSSIDKGLETEKQNNIAKKVSKQLKKFGLGFPSSKAYPFTLTKAGEIEHCFILPNVVIDGVRLYLKNHVECKGSCPDYLRYSFAMYVKSSEPKHKERYLVNIYDKFRGELPHERIFALERMMCECNCRYYSWGSTTKTGRYRFCKHIIAALCSIIFDPLKDPGKYFLQKLKPKEEVRFLNETKESTKNRITTTMYHITTFLLTLIFLSSEIKGGHSLDKKLKEKIYEKCLRNWQNTLGIKRDKKLGIGISTPQLNDEIVHLDCNTVAQIAYTILEDKDIFSKFKLKKASLEKLSEILSACDMHRKELEDNEISFDKTPANTISWGRKTLDSFAPAKILNTLNERINNLNLHIKNAEELVKKFEDLHATNIDYTRRLDELPFPEYANLHKELKADLENMNEEKNYLEAQFKITDSLEKITIDRKLWERIVTQKMRIYKIFDFYFKLALICRETRLNLRKERSLNFINFLLSKTLPRHSKEVQFEKAAIDRLALLYKLLEDKILFNLVQD